MKTQRCSRCDTTKKIDSFGFKNKERGTRQAWCRPCRVEYHREWRKRPGNMGKHAYYIERRKRELLAMVHELKRAPCADCDKTFDPEGMDFDHVRGKKTASIAHLCSKGAAKKLEEELKKCELVCAVCHRIRTKGRRKKKKKLIKPATRSGTTLS